MELLLAKKVAEGICLKLQPYTTKIYIAGSIRRLKPIVKDIEIVCLPLMLLDDYGGDMFNQNKLKIADDFIKVVKSLGTIEKGQPDGRYCKMIIKIGNEIINLDLFMPVEDDFYRQYAVRTGPAEYSHRVLAGGWRKIGWVGSDLGLRQQKDCVEHKLPGGKSRWECVRNKNSKPPMWSNEKSFFDWINVPFISPELRIV